MSVQLKRIYEEVENKDGVRVLVDRIWPRGMSKKEAHLDHWMKKIGPTNDLRKWFGHDPSKYNDFKKRYKQELDFDEQQLELKILKELNKKHNGNLTLLFAAKDEENNQAKVIKEILDQQ